MRFGGKYCSKVPGAAEVSCQKSDETSQQFETDVVHQVRLVYPTATANFLEQLAVQVFFDGTTLRLHVDHL